MNKKTKKIIMFIGIGYILFAAIVFTGYIIIRYNPVDKVAMTYIWNSEDIARVTGEIKHVNRTTLEKSLITKAYIIIPYHVEASSSNKIILMKMTKAGGKWTVLGYQIKESK